MSSLAYDLAVFERLTGAPLDSQGRPIRGVDGRPTNLLVPGPPNVGMKPSYGIRIPEMRGQDTKHGLSTRDPDAVRIFRKGFEPQGFRQVPVFSENVEGRQWEDIWPCVSFRLTRKTPNRATYVYDDPIVTDDTSSEYVTITNRHDETVQSGYAKQKSRKHPDAYDFFYLIRAHAKSEMEIAYIENAILVLFPQVSALLVEQADGTTHACDMFLEDIMYSEGDDAQPGIGDEEFRPYIRGYTVRVEGYMDNSTNEFGMDDIHTENRITQRILELRNVQLTMAENPGDVNLQELEEL